MGKVNLVSRREFFPPQKRGQCLTQYTNLKTRKALDRGKKNKLQRQRKTLDSRKMQYTYLSAFLLRSAEKTPRYSTSNEHKRRGKKKEDGLRNCSMQNSTVGTPSVLVASMEHALDFGNYQRVQTETSRGKLHSSSKGLTLAACASSPIPNS